MTKVNKHGLEMNGLRDAAGETRNFPNRFGSRIQVGYNHKTGEIRCTFHVTPNSWTEWNDENVIHVGYFSRKTTMQEIADCIAEVLPIEMKDREEYRRMMAEDEAWLDSLEEE